MNQIFVLRLIGQSISSPWYALTGFLHKILGLLADNADSFARYFRTLHQNFKARYRDMFCYGESLHRCAQLHDILGSNRRNMPVSWYRGSQVYLIHCIVLTSWGNLIFIFVLKCH
jgi:hypothetical protein